MCLSATAFSDVFEMRLVSVKPGLFESVLGEVFVKTKHSCEIEDYTVVELRLNENGGLAGNKDSFFYETEVPIVNSDQEIMYVTKANECLVLDTMGLPDIQSVSESSASGVFFKDSGFLYLQSVDVCESFYHKDCDKWSVSLEIQEDCDLSEICFVVKDMEQN